MCFGESLQFTEVIEINMLSGTPVKRDITLRIFFQCRQQNRTGVRKPVPPAIRSIGASLFSGTGFAVWDINGHPAVIQIRSITAIA